jgi:hypothetical protein
MGLFFIAEMKLPATNRSTKATVKKDIKFLTSKRIVGRG